jgi:hydrogenase nickel incorporation protein HypA/HybF
MHELSLTESLLDIIEEYALKHHFERVTSLKLSLGRLSCVDPSALEFAFQVQSRGTRAEGARLEFHISPAVLYCFSCQQHCEVERFEATCPHCDTWDVVLTGGTEELTLVEMDVDEEI